MGKPKSLGKKGSFLMQFGEKVQVKIQFSTCFVSTACITDVWYLR